MLVFQKNKWLLVLLCGALLTLFVLPHFVAGKESSTEILLQGLNFQEIKAGAENGDAHLEFLLGVIYHDGRGVERDEWEAVKWLGKAAEQGHTQAQYSLGTRYGTGKGIVKDYIEACKWFELAAAQRGPSQQEAIKARELLASLMTSREIAEAKRRAAAFVLHKESGRQTSPTARSTVSSTVPQTPELIALKAQAEKGDARAQNNLGKAYEKGKGTTRDYVEAIKWYRSATEQDYADAQYNLGFMHYRGDGVKKDYSEAARWFRKAAEQGCDVAQFMLGLMYHGGQGLAQDDVEACKWLDLSVAKGRIDLEKQSAKTRKELRQRMTPQQLAEASRRVAAFVPRKESEK